MNTILTLLSGAFDIALSYVRELCMAILLVVLIVGGSHLLHMAKQDQDEQRAALYVFSHPQSDATNAPASKSCAWLKTDGTNTTCVTAQSAP